MTSCSRISADYDNVPLRWGTFEPRDFEPCPACPHTRYPGGSCKCTLPDRWEYVRVTPPPIYHPRPRVGTRVYPCVSRDGAPCRAPTRLYSEAQHWRWQQLAQARTVRPDLRMDKCHSEDPRCRTAYERVVRA